MAKNIFGDTIIDDVASTKAPKKNAFGDTIIDDDAATPASSVSPYEATRAGRFSGQPPPTPERPSATSRFFSNLGNTLNPLPMIDRITGASELYNTGKSLIYGDYPSAVIHGAEFAKGPQGRLGDDAVNAATDQFKQAKDYWKAGRYSEAGGHALAGALPVFGPMAANVGEQLAGEPDRSPSEQYKQVGPVREPDIAGGLGVVAGQVAQYGIGKGVQRIGEGLAYKPSNAPVSDSTAPQRGPLGTLVNKLGRAMEPESSVQDRLVRALKPTNTQINFEKSASAAAPEIQESARKLGKPITTIEDLLEASKDAKQRMWQYVLDGLGPRAKQGLDISGAAQAGRDAVTAATPGMDREQIPQHTKGLSIYEERPWTVNEIEGEIERLNAATNTYRAKLPQGQSIDLRSNPETAAKVAVVDHLRDTLNNYLESTTAGPVVRQAKKLYGALKEVENTAQKRSVVVGRQALQNLPEQLARARGMKTMAKGAVKAAFGHPFAGAVDIASGALEPEVASYLAERNSTNGELQRAFEDPSKLPAAYVPPAPVIPPNQKQLAPSTLPFSAQGVAYNIDSVENMRRAAEGFPPKSPGVNTAFRGVQGPGGPQAQSIPQPPVLPRPKALLGDESPWGTSATGYEIPDLRRKAEGYPPKAPGLPNTAAKMVKGPGGTWMIEPIAPEPAPTRPKGMLGGTADVPTSHAPPVGFRGEFQSPLGSAPATPESAGPGQPPLNTAASATRGNPLGRAFGIGLPDQPPEQGPWTDQFGRPWTRPSTSTVGPGAGSQAFHIPEDPIRMPSAAPRLPGASPGLPHRPPPPEYVGPKMLPGRVGEQPRLPELTTSGLDQWAEEAAKYNEQLAAVHHLTEAETQSAKNAKVALNPELSQRYNKYRQPIDSLGRVGPKAEGAKESAQVFKGAFKAQTPEAIRAQQLSVAADLMQKARAKWAPLYYEQSTQVQSAIDGQLWQKVQRDLVEQGLSEADVKGLTDWLSKNRGNAPTPKPKPAGTRPVLPGEQYPLLPPR